MISLPKCSESAKSQPQRKPLHFRISVFSVSAFTQTPPISPPSGPLMSFLKGLHPKSKSLAIISEKTNLAAKVKDLAARLT
jgi:hypothetical protein